MDERRRAQHPRRSWRLLAWAACALLVSLSGMTAAAWGAFSDQASAALDVRAATLEPPTLASTEAGACTAGVSDAIVLKWTASTTAAVTGYEILRATAEAGPYSPIGTVTGRTVESYTDTPLSFATTYHYVLRSIKERTGEASRPLPSPESPGRRAAGEASLDRES